MKNLEEALNIYREKLEEGPVLHRHLSSLYDTLLEQTLYCLIRCLFRVQISHISDLIGLRGENVENKFSQMILAKTLVGPLDQGARYLIIFDALKREGIYPSTLETISNITKVV